jgi:SAM-dependent methyltransferase
VASLSSDEIRWFEKKREFHETHYLPGSNPRQQSGFGRDERDWERFRRPVLAPVDRDGTFLDIGCANGLLMESAFRWAHEDGRRLEPYGLDLSEKLAELARQRLPHWRERIFAGNALVWEPPRQFDFVRTELVYVPRPRRHDYVEHLLARVVAPGGRLIVCSYGSSRPEGQRAEALLDELRDWRLPIHGVFDAVSPEHAFVITHVVSLAN